MCTHKSKKISEVINKSDEDLNLHEIKAKTGAVNGLSSTNTTPSEMIDNNNPTHKSHKINEVFNEHGSDLNLHEIKAKTGAGSGHKYTTIPSNDNVSKVQHKSHNIYDVVTKIEGKANIHKIKAQTGAGNGYKDHSKSAVNNSNNTTSNESMTHKSHRIHALFHNSDRKFNLHEIKARTGAGSGYKH